MTQITITTSAPADPATVTEYGDALPELVRALNHVTMHHEALEFPSDADRLIRNAALAVSRLPQLLSQAGAWLAHEQAAGRIEVPRGEAPATVVLAARMRLERAAQIASELQEALDFAASVTSGMGAPELEDGSEEGSDG